MIVVKKKGDFKKTVRAFEKFLRRDHTSFLDKYGRMGVEALASVTPLDSGDTAGSWGYEIHNSGGRYEIVFTNSNVNQGLPIAILIQYGHGTGTGGYVQGIDYINPAIRPIFEQMVDDIWKEVTTT